MPIYARTSGDVYKTVSKILTADGSEIGKVVDSTGRIIYEASRLITVTGVPPITLTKSIGKPLVSWDLLGNAQQTGTPSPDNIIMPTFCGVRTAQLFDKDNTLNGYRIDSDGEPFADGGCVLSDYIPVSGNTAYIQNVGFSYSNALAEYDDSKTFIKRRISGNGAVTTDSATRFIRVSYRKTAVDSIMLNLGSTALPYEPYGYKIPFGIHGDNLTPTINEWVDGYISETTGSIVTPSATYIEKSSEYIEIPNNAAIVVFSGEDGSFEIGSSGAWRAIAFYDSNKTFVSRLGGRGSNAMVVSVPEGTKYMRVSCRTYGSDKECMLNLGSTAKPYSPYFSETVPVYLGQTQTVRRVKKYEFTGQETVGTSGSGYLVNIKDAIGVAMTVVTDAICSHYQAHSYSQVYYGEEFGFAQRSGSSISTRGFSFSKGEIETPQDFRTYLTQQYANGTPVTIWYVLAEPETAIVNEPLAKIGDYADELHSIDAAVTIPTANGDNTLTVDTDLPPSSMTIVYKGR